MNRILTALVLVAGLAVSSHAAGACAANGYTASNTCIKAENILDGILGVNVVASGVGVTTSPAGVAITYGLSVGSVTVSDFASVGGALTVTGTAATGALTVTGAATVSTTLGVTGATTVSTITATGYTQLASRTKAVLATITPSVVGQQFFCSDCTVDSIAIATQTVNATWASLAAKTTKAQ
jgi:hypothetical protein